MKRNHRVNTSTLPPLTPDQQPYKFQSAQLASLETRLNGQQKRIEDQENFIARLLRELHTLRVAISDMGAPLKPGRLGRQAQKGKGL
jgi:hypothetical protein